MTDDLLDRVATHANEDGRTVPREIVALVKEALNAREGLVRAVAGVLADRVGQ